MDKKPDISQLLRLSQSTQGQKLLKRVQQSGGDSLKQAIASGDWNHAKAILSPLLQDQEVALLLKKLEETL